MQPIISAVLIFAISISIVALVLNFSDVYFLKSKEKLSEEVGSAIIEKIKMQIEHTWKREVGYSLEYSFYLPDGEIEIKNCTISLKLNGNLKKVKCKAKTNSIKIAKGKRKLKISKKENLVFLELLS